MTFCVMFLAHKLHKTPKEIREMSKDDLLLCLAWNGKQSGESEPSVEDMFNSL